MLDGFKTLITAAIAVLAAILAFFAQEITLLQMLEAIGVAVGIGGTRLVAKAGELFASAQDPTSLLQKPFFGQMVTYAGTAMTVLTAILAGMNGEQDPIVTISAVLSALGITFLGLGVKKSVDATKVAISTSSTA